MIILLVIVSVVTFFFLDASASDVIHCFVLYYHSVHAYGVTSAKI